MCNCFRVKIKIMNERLFSKAKYTFKFSKTFRSDLFDQIVIFRTTKRFFKAIKNNFTNENNIYTRC